MRNAPAPKTAPPAPAEPVGHRGRDIGILAAIALGWLAAILWSAHATIVGSADPLLGMTQAALALPSVITASMLGGGAVGLLAVELSRRRFPPRAAVRYGAGTVGGLAVGLAGAGLVLLVYGTTGAILIVAAALAAASVLGGILAGVRSAAMVAASFAGLLAWFAVGVARGLFSGQLMDVFGAGNAAASQKAASDRLSLAVAIAGGVVAGATAYRYLRRREGDAPRWPAYLVTGGGPGLLLLLADLATLVGGAQLLRVAGSTSAFDRAVVAYLSESRIETGLVVFFVGALTALLLFGRRLRAPDDDPAPDGATTVEEDAG